MPPGVVGAPIQNGRFVSTVDAARALLCLADDLPGDTQGAPFRVNGCAVIERGAGAAGDVRLSTGFGGVQVAPA